MTRPWISSTFPPVSDAAVCLASGGIPACGGRNTNKKNTEKCQHPVFQPHRGKHENPAVVISSPGPQRRHNNSSDGPSTLELGFNPLAGRRACSAQRKDGGHGAGARSCQTAGCGLACDASSSPAHSIQGSSVTPPPVTPAHISIWVKRLAHWRGAEHRADGGGKE